MIAKTSEILIAVVLAALLSTVVHAGEAEDTRVEQGVAFYDEGDYEQAKSILLPLAKSGQPKAMNVIGMLHQNTPVFPNDPKTECDWYERAAMAGYSSGMFNLSICYFVGHGRTLDKEQSYIWLTKAAKLGDVDAMLHLSKRENNSPDERLYWLKKASKSGSKFAAAILWDEGHKKEVPDFTFLDQLCITVRIGLMEQSRSACDD